MSVPASVILKNAQINATSLVLSDIFPEDYDFWPEFLIRSQHAPKGVKLVDCGSTASSNCDLIRKIFMYTYKLIMHEIYANNCRFYFPNNSKAYFAVTLLNNKSLFRGVDPLQTEYRNPYVVIKNASIYRKTIYAYAPPVFYTQLKIAMNNGENPSKVPRKIDYFLPYVYEEFQYIEPRSIKKIVLYGFSKILESLQAGENINIGQFRLFVRKTKLEMRVSCRNKHIRLQKQKYAQFFI